MTIEEIQAVIENEKQSQSALSGITSSSKVGVWTQIKYVFANVAALLFYLFDTWKVQVETTAAARPWATVQWYIEQAKLYQHGDILEVSSDSTYKYPVLNPDKQLIVQAAIDVVDRELRLKVATMQNSQLAQVPDEVMASFAAYFEQIKRPGTIVRYINEPADLLRLRLKIWFDGELIEAVLRNKITESVKTYLRDIVFNGVFSVTRLIDTIQLINGVSEVLFVEGTARSAAQTIEYATQIESRYKSTSGYFAIEKIGDVEQLFLELIRES